MRLSPTRFFMILKALVKMAEQFRATYSLTQFNDSEINDLLLSDAGVRVSIVPLMGHINLRGDINDPIFLKSVQRVLGVRLPSRPNHVSESDELAALWLGPDEWLLLIPSTKKAAIVLQLRDVSDNLFVGVSDITGGQTMINIQGNQAIDLLNKGCSLDLHPREFYPGRCAQTNVGKAMAIIWCISDSPSFNLIVRRSFFDYLGTWLKDAGKEYGILFRD